MTLSLPWRSTPLTKDEADDLFMLFLEDDTADAPWMVMGDLQYWSATVLAHSLRLYVLERGFHWYVASMLPIIFPWLPIGETRRLAPDLFVALVPDRERTSFDVTTEGGFPPFVLEVVSPSSTTRDRRIKRKAYDLMGVKEYFLFTPRQAKPSTLEGYRRSASGQFEHTRADANLCLASEILGLTFVVRGKMLRVVTPDGEVLPTLAEAEAARRQAEEHARQAEEGRRRAEEERAQERSRANSAEAEVARLREELGRLRRLTNRDEGSG